MLNVIMVHGEAVNLFDNEDFVRLLNDRLGEDAAQWFRDAIQQQREKLLEDVRENPHNFCNGECDRLYE